MNIEGAGINPPDIGLRSDREQEEYQRAPECAPRGVQCVQLETCERFEVLMTTTVKITVF
jgi:hypothetical protein